MRWCCRPVQWYFFTWSSPLLLLPRLFGGVYMMGTNSSRACCSVRGVSCGVLRVLQKVSWACLIGRGNTT